MESLLIWLLMNIHNILLVALIICIIFLVINIYKLFKLLYQDLQNEIKTLDRKVTYLYKNK
jgi:uncharacterized protein YoxC